jgi:hypothetical protein
MGAYGQSRDTLYVDEGYVSIDEFAFKKKIHSKLYYERLYDLDTILLKKLFLKYFLGELKPATKDQLFGLLAQRNDVDTTKIIFIHYQDTLKARDSYPREDRVVPLANGGHQHIPSYHSFMRAHRICEKKYRDDPKINMYHFFHFNQGHPLSVKKYTWHKDPLDVIRKLFYNKEDHTRMWSLFLYPDGGYTILYGGMSEEMYADLKEHKNWDQHLKTFREQYQTVNPEIDLGASGGK